MILIGLAIVVFFLILNNDNSHVKAIDMSNRLVLPCGCVAKYSNSRRGRSVTSTHNGYWSRCDACKRSERDFNKITRQFR